MYLGLRLPGSLSAPGKLHPRLSKGHRFAIQNGLVPRLYLGMRCLEAPASLGNITATFDSPASLNIFLVL